MTDSMSIVGVLQVMSTHICAFLAILLAASGIHKLLQRDRASRAIQEFAGVSPSVAPALSATVAMLELSAAALLWLPTSRILGSVFAAVIWGGYLGLMTRALAQGRRDLDCGCSFGGAQHPLGTFHVARNAFLTAIAVAVALISARTGAASIGAPPILAGFAFFALYCALDQVMALQPPRAGELL